MVKDLLNSALQSILQIRERNRMTDMDLKTIERATYRGSFSDGLLDLFTGIALSFLGLLWLTDYAAFGGLAPALLIPV